MVVREQVDDKEFLHDLDIGVGFHFCDECHCDVFSGFVAVGVRDATATVAAFEGCRDGAMPGVEFCAPVLELLYEFGAFFHDGVDDVFVAEAAAGSEGVFDVGVEGVALVEDGSDAALRFPGIRVFELAFTDEYDVFFVCEFDCGAQARDAGADDEAVGEKLLGSYGVDVDEVTPEFLL